MLCRGEPKDLSAYYPTTNRQFIYFMMKNGVQPLYHDKKMFYFARTGVFEKWLVEYTKSLRKEEAEIGTEAM